VLSIIFVLIRTAIVKTIIVLHRQYPVTQIQHVPMGYAILLIVIQQGDAPRDLEITDTELEGHIIVEEDAMEQGTAIMLLIVCSGTKVKQLV
jgi:hypothetical protein